MQTLTQHDLQTYITEDGGSIIEPMPPRWRRVRRTGGLGGLVLEYGGTVLDEAVFSEGFRALRRGRKTLYLVATVTDASVTVADHKRETCPQCSAPLSPVTGRVEAGWRKVSAPQVPAEGRDWQAGDMLPGFLPPGVPVPAGTTCPVKEYRGCSRCDPSVAAWGYNP